MSARADDGPRFEVAGQSILVLARLIRPGWKQRVAPGAPPLRDDEAELFASLEVAVRTAMYADDSTSPTSPSGSDVDDDSGTIVYVSTTHAAGLLGCTPRWVRELARAGAFRSRMVGGRWQVALEDVEQRRDEEKAA